MEQRFAVRLGQKVHQQTPHPIPVQHQAGKDTPVRLGGILTNTSEAPIGVAIQAHLPKDRGRGGVEGRGRKEEEEQVYEEKEAGAGEEGAVHARRV